MCRYSDLLFLDRRPLYPCIRPHDDDIDDLDLEIALFRFRPRPNVDEQNPGPTVTNGKAKHANRNSYTVGQNGSHATSRSVLGSNDSLEAIHYLNEQNASEDRTDVSRSVLAQAPRHGVESSNGNLTDQSRLPLHHDDRSALFGKATSLKSSVSCVLIDEDDDDDDTKAAEDHLK